MPEQLTDSETRELFTDLRAGQLSHVRPPGVVTVRRTVRRRRIVASVAAGLAVLGVSGLAVGAVSHSDRPLVTGGATPQPVASGRSDPARVALSSQAADSLPVPEGESVEFGRSTEDVLGGLQVPAGYYTLHVRCLGAGTLTARLGSDVDQSVPGAVQPPGGPAPDSATATVPCGETAEIVRVPFRMSKSGSLWHTVSTDDLARRESGFAYAVTLDEPQARRFMQQARDLLSGGGPAVVVGASNNLNGRPIDSWNQSRAPRQ